MKSCARSNIRSNSKLLRAVRAEAATLAVKFGFERGPLLRQAVLDERKWWDENGFGHEDPLTLDLDSDRAGL